MFRTPPRKQNTDNKFQKCDIVLPEEFLPLTISNHLTSNVAWVQELLPNNIIIIIMGSTFKDPIEKIEAADKYMCAPAPITDQILFIFFLLQPD